MKKLMMIAAAMTIAGGAFGSACNPGDEPDAYCAIVYKVKMSLRTTDAKSSTTKDGCDELCYRQPSKVSLMGYAHVCDACDCDALADMSWQLWNKKNKYMYIDTDESAEVTWGILNVIGKKATDVEAALSFETDALYLLAAGFGKMDSKACLPKKISGNVAGYGLPPSCITTTGTVCEPGDDIVECAYAFECADYCEGDAFADTDLETVYFGTWSMSYSKSESNKYAEDWDIFTKIPAYPEYVACGEYASPTNEIPAP